MKSDIFHLTCGRHTGNSWIMPFAVCSVFYTMLNETREMRCERVSLWAQQSMRWGGETKHEMCLLFGCGFCHFFILFRFHFMFLPPSVRFFPCSWWMIDGLLALLLLPFNNATWTILWIRNNIIYTHEVTYYIYKYVYQRKSKVQLCYIPLHCFPVVGVFQSCPICNIS